MSLVDLIYKCVEDAPGCTSSEICGKHPTVGKHTITSGVSKLKKRNRLIGVTREDGATLLFTPAAYDKSKYAPLHAPKMHAEAKKAPVKKSVPLPEKASEVEDFQSVDIGKIMRVLAPFADFGQKMSKNQIVGQPFVWLSATSMKPTIVLEDGGIFLAASSLFKELQMK